MCNENTHKDPLKQDPKILHDYRFIDYRLNQLGKDINKGLDKLEKEQDTNYKELIKLLRMVQENSNKQNEKLVGIEEKQKAIDEKIQDIGKIKELLAKHNERITSISNRLDIYKKIMIGVIITVVGTLILAVMKLI